MYRLAKPIHGKGSGWFSLSPLKFVLMGHLLRAIHFKEETIWLCHPERSEGSLSGERSFAALRMTLLKRLRLTRKTSSLKCIALCGCLVNYETGCRCRITCSISGAVFGLPLEYGWL